MAIEHGTRSMYNNHKCRCIPCKRAHRDYQRGRQQPSYRELSSERKQASRDCALAYSHTLKGQEQRRTYRKTTKGKIARRQSNHRRARAINFTPDAVDYMFMLSGDPCSYCGEPMETIDHIEPVAKNGSSDWDNLTAACKRCNSKKQAQSLLIFLLKG